ncbi:disease resistance protein At4g27190-like [Eucalyptus grandis]|uniref:disease resistance protein At4g27190-like n=1 Tax=Eucalyptus grandis TaxID=71139 RepID=UPI00192E85FB|nr:disease resistance protein At4g27190-like [Eucalyptus grandis]
MAEVVLCAASTVAGCLVAPVDRLCGYVISYDSHVRELEAKVAELGNARQEVQKSIDYAQNNVKPIGAYVNKWVEDVDKHAEEARRALDDYRRANETCFYGWLPNLKVRYRLGREARRKAECIQGLIDRKPSGEVYDDPPPGLVDGTSNVISSAGDRGDTTFDSRASILEDIMNALYDEEHKVIGVYGPGGVGKTTLLEEVNKKLRKEGRPFNMIVKARVSQTPDLNDIQYQIADDLNLNLKDKQSQQGRRDLLFQRLQKDPNEKVLIILDDLWKEFDLKEVGIPSGDESRGCKLLLTSRFKDVLEQMKCDTPIFHLEGLKDKEAFGLFEKTVGDRLKDDEELKAIAPKVVKKLAGLPLLIISVACSLKDRDVAAWRIALKKIDRSKMESIVKLSYGHLKSEDTKILFLLCGLIGGTICVEILLVLGMGLGLFKEFGRTIQDSRDGLNTMLDELRSVCLLLDGGDDKNDVTIHDLYSEVVVSNAFSGQDSLIINNDYGSWPKEKLEKCWACLVNVGSDRLAELMLGRFRHVKILMLSEQYDMGDCSIMDFTYMGELRVLCLGSMCIKSLPSSMEFLGNLQSLSINCHVEDVANLGKLKALQILSITESKISRLPKEIGKLTNLRSLNLSCCSELQIIELGTLKGLINLEELHMYRSFDQWMGKHGKSSKSCNARLVELKSLTNLASLKISIPDPIILLEAGDLPLENLDKFWIQIGDARWRDYEGLTTMKLNLEGCDSILQRKWVKKNLQKTQHLYLCKWSEFKESPRELCTQGFQEVKYLGIENSPSIKYIADSSKDLPLTAFGKLESFFLEDLINLEKICHGPIAPESFNKLKAVRVKQCNKLKYLWCLSDVQRLVQLEEIEVSDCDSMQSIVTHHAGEDIVSTDNKVELPNVRRMVLDNLPKMPESFNKLKAVRVKQCNKLKYLWCLSYVQRLVQLEEIEVSDCDSMQSIVTHHAGEDIVSTNNKVELPNVRRMVLDNLPKMTGFCDTSIQVSLPHLESPIMVGLLGLEEILYSQPSLKYNNLTYLMIKMSKSTSKSILKSDWILKLPNLQSLRIDSAPLAEVVFELEELKVTRDVKILSRLIELTLMWLPNLRHMWIWDVKLQGISILRNLRKLFVNETGLSFLFPVSVAICFREIREIKVLSCPNMKAVIVDEGRNEATYDIIEFPQLECLSIRQCPMKKFFSYPCGKKEPVTTTSDSQDANSDSFFDRKVTIPNITSLNIDGLLCEELWNKQIPTDSFQKLESLELRNCDNLQHIAPPQMWKVLQRCLKNLVVMSCHLIEIIYEGHGMDIEGGELRKLILRDLKNIKHIWQSEGLPNVPFPNLIDVEARRCPHLEMLFTTFTAKILGQIQELVVESCEDMKLIAGHEKGEEGTGTTVTFSKLTVLRLFKLPNFRGFLHEKYSQKFSCPKDFPSLELYSIESCGEELDQACGDWREHEVEQRELSLQSPDVFLQYFIALVWLSIPLNRKSVCIS